MASMSFWARTVILVLIGAFDVCQATYTIKVNAGTGCGGSSEIQTGGWDNGNFVPCRIGTFFGQSEGNFYCTRACKTRFGLPHWNFIA